MTLRAHHLVVSLFAGAVVLSSLALLAVDPQPAQAACPTGSSVVITSSTSSGSGSTGTLSQIFTLRAETAPAMASGLSFMLYPTQQSLGEATLDGTRWALNWDTRNHPNGTYQVVAVAHFSNTTSLDCASPAVPVNIENVPTQAPTLAASISPSTWQGLPGASAAFALDVLFTDKYGRKSHVAPGGVNWFSSLGVASPVNTPSTVFRAGTTAGTGLLSANVAYGGLTTTTNIPIKVLTTTSTTNTTTSTPTPTPQTTTKPADVTATTSPTTAPKESLTPAEASRLAAMPTVFRPSAPTNSDPVVTLPTLACLEKVVGAVRFAEISSGKSRPTAAERKLASGCFSGAEPIPAVLAPVAPASLTELRTTSDIVTLDPVKNHSTTSSDGTKISGLLLSGKGAPNTSIFIYVFSDPLVLRAETNAQGEWSYVLENPLDAGDHEVYAVAEKDSGNFVRTAAVPITIAAAAPGSQDGKLVIDRGWSSGQVGFAAGAVVLVLAAFGVLFTILRRRRLHQKVSPPPAPVQPSLPTSPPAPLIHPQTPSAVVPAPPTDQPRP